jgi:WD40 repeat protein
VSPDGQWQLGKRGSPSLEFSKVGSGLVGLLAHDADVLDAGFSFDGRWLVTSSADGAVRMWPLRIPDLIAQACKVLPRNLTRGEWNSFGMETEYHKTCPNLP